MNFKITLRKPIFFLLSILICCFVLPASNGIPLTIAQSEAAVKTPVQRYGRLKVSGAQLVDSKNRPVQLKGVSTHGLSCFRNM